MLGFGTVLDIFGVTLLTPVLPAMAKDIPTNRPKPSDLCPAPTQKPALVPSDQIIHGLTGAVASISALAVSSSSFMIGALCGVAVVVGILKVQGK